MRIIAGQWRGRVLKAPAGEATRPTSDRAREALVLDARQPGRRVRWAARGGSVRGLRRARAGGALARSRALHLRGAGSRCCRRDQGQCRRARRQRGRARGQRLGARCDRQPVRSPAVRSALRQRWRRRADRTAHPARLGGARRVGQRGDGPHRDGLRRRLEPGTQNAATARPSSPCCAAIRPPPERQQRDQAHRARPRSDRGPPRPARRSAPATPPRSGSARRR